MAKLLGKNNYQDWSKINGAIHQKLGLDEKTQVRAYHHAEMAVMDQMVTLVQFLSHKKTVYFQRGVSPYFESIIPHFLRDSLKIQNILPAEHLSTTDQREEWIKNIAPDTCCAVLCANHWVTGEKFEIQPLVDALEAKRIYVLVVNHGDASMLSEKPTVYKNILHDLGDIVFSVMGARWKNPTLVSWQGRWDAENFDKDWTRVTSALPDETEVKKFESEFSKETFFTNGQSRVWNKAVLVFPDINAQMLRANVASQLGVTGVDDELFGTIIECDETIYPPLRMWWRPDPAPVTVRGMIQFSVSALKKYPNLAHVVKTVAAGLVSEQTWEA
ncbi:MAG: hypothetical protein V4736_04570 [Bdellovibrionota bacterium]